MSSNNNLPMLLLNCLDELAAQEHEPGYYKLYLAIINHLKHITLNPKLQPRFDYYQNKLKLTNEDNLPQTESELLHYYQEKVLALEQQLEKSEQLNHQLAQNTAQMPNIMSIMTELHEVKRRVAMTIEHLENYDYNQPIVPGETKYTKWYRQCRYMLAMDRQLPTTQQQYSSRGRFHKRVNWNSLKNDPGYNYYHDLLLQEFFGQTKKDTIQEIN